MDELDHQKVIKKIIYKELEPSVLNEEIITKAIYDQGPSGEAGRIFREMEIQHEKIVVLRLEFLSKYFISSHELGFKDIFPRHSQDRSSVDPSKFASSFPGIQQNRQN